MGKQLSYGDVQVGMELPPLVKRPTTRQLVMWAGASDDYFELHYDKDFASSHGLPGVLVHGALTSSFLAQLVTDWIGKQGTIKKFGCQFRGMHFPGEDLVCKGKVTKRYRQDSEGDGECELWSENPKGERQTTGMAIITLPGR